MTLPEDNTRLDRVREPRRVAVKIIDAVDDQFNLSFQGKSYSVSDYGEQLIKELVESELQNLRSELAREIEGLKLDNPYPSDIFTPITSKQWAEIDKLLSEKMGFRIDRVSGNLCRKGFNVAEKDYKESVLAIIKEKK